MDENLDKIFCSQTKFFRVTLCARIGSVSLFFEFTSLLMKRNSSGLGWFLWYILKYVLYWNKIALFYLADDY